MDETSPRTQLKKIRDFEKGFIATHLINIGAKLGLFEALYLSKEGMTTTDLASKLGLHEPYLKIWCQTAYYFEILDCDNNGRFVLQPFLDDILGDKSHYRYYLWNIAFTVDILGRSFTEYPDYYQTGQTAATPNIPEYSRLVSEITRNVHLVFLLNIFPENDRLRKMLERGCRFLDIGCGRGNLIIQLAQEFKNSTFIGVDIDTYGIEEAENRISQMALEKQVSVENIGGEKLPYSDEIDIASMVITLHEIHPDVRVKVVENAHRALRSGGQLLVLDYPYPGKLEDFRNPMNDFGILDQFFETNWGTVHLNMHELDEMLTKVGFENIQRMTVIRGLFELVSATK